MAGMARRLKIKFTVIVFISLDTRLFLLLFCLERVKMFGC